jgi:SAM-dependent methyltransferase
MQAEIQRQYDEIIASHYDFDPQAVIGDSLDRALSHIERHGGSEPAWRALDLGVGTGRFLEKLRGWAGQGLEPYGLDLSRKMLDIACRRIPDLAAAAGDARDLDSHFDGISFDLIGTHFITGFVPVGVLAPKIHDRLEKGGLWSFVGGTQAGFPALLKKGQSRLVRWLLGIKQLEVGELVCNPADEAEVVRIFEQNGFDVLEVETFRPEVRFKDLDQFLEFAYYGGWLTPFVESMGLHKAGPVTRAVMNSLVFPVRDHHSIVLALAQKQ